MKMHEGYIVVSDDGKKNFYYFVDDFANGFALVKKDGIFGKMDTSGNVTWK